MMASLDTFELMRQSWEFALCCVSGGPVKDREYKNQWNMIPHTQNFQGWARLHNYWKPVFSLPSNSYYTSTEPRQGASITTLTSNAVLIIYGVTSHRKGICLIGKPMPGCSGMWSSRLCGRISCVLILAHTGLTVCWQKPFPDWGNESFFVAAIFLIITQLFSLHQYAIGITFPW